jgi:hypothetical protein
MTESVVAYLPVTGALATHFAVQETGATIYFATHADLISSFTFGEPALALASGANIIEVDIPSTQIVDIDTPSVQVREVHGDETSIVDVSDQSGPIEVHGHSTTIVVQ